MRRSAAPAHGHHRECASLLRRTMSHGTIARPAGSRTTRPAISPDVVKTNDGRREVGAFRHRPDRTGPCGAVSLVQRADQHRSQRHTSGCAHRGHEVLGLSSDCGIHGGTPDGRVVSVGANDGEPGHAIGRDESCLIRQAIAAAEQRSRPRCSAAASQSTASMPPSAISSAPDDRNGEPCRRQPALKLGDLACEVCESRGGRQLGEQRRDRVRAGDGARETDACQHPQARAARRAPPPAVGASRAKHDCAERSTLTWFRR